MSERIRIETDKAPPSTGFRSQGLIAGGFMFTGGMIGAPLNPTGGVRAPADSLAEQTDLALAHLEQVALAGGASREDVVELSAFYVPAAGKAIVHERVVHFLGREPALFNAFQVADVALHGLLELDWIANVEPGRSTAQTVEVLRPFGHGTGLVRSGPFVMLNGLLGEGASLGEASVALLAEAEQRLRAAGSALDQSVKLTVYIADFDSYPQFNDATRQAFANFTPPTRSVLVAPHMTQGRPLRVDWLALAGA